MNPKQKAVWELVWPWAKGQNPMPNEMALRRLMDQIYQLAEGWSSIPDKSPGGLHASLSASMRREPVIGPNDYGDALAYRMQKAMREIEQTQHKDPPGNGTRIENDDFYRSIDRAVRKKHMEALVAYLTNRPGSDQMSAEDLSGKLPEPLIISYCPSKGHNVWESEDILGPQDYPVECPPQKFPRVVVIGDGRVRVDTERYSFTGTIYPDGTVIVDNDQKPFDVHNAVVDFLSFTAHSMESIKSIKEFSDALTVQPDSNYFHNSPPPQKKRRKSNIDTRAKARVKRKKKSR